MLPRKIVALRAIMVMQILFVTHVGTQAQSIPASSADSGRRAVVAVDQASINNNINNAAAAANNAWSYANIAYGTAVNATNIGNAAVNLGYAAQGAADTAQSGVNWLASRGTPGTIIGYYVWMNGTNVASRGLCVTGYPSAIYGGGYGTVGPAQTGCPGGSGPYEVYGSSPDMTGGGSGGGGSGF